MQGFTNIDHKIITKIICQLLINEGVEETGAKNVADGLVHASLRGVDSHGIRLTPHYVKAVKAGRINPKPNYEFLQTNFATGILDADHAFGHAAGMKAVEKAVELANNAGVGMVAVKKSSHFGAASFFALEISKHDMIGMSFTHSDSLIIPTGSKQRFLGNNPICFTAPCEGEDPICLDMATSVITFNKVLQHQEENKDVPPGVGADKDGNETTNPFDIIHLLPVGGHKGYGLSLMVEILCSLLTSMPFGPHISKMYNSPIEEKRYLGQFYIAIKVDSFVETGSFKVRMRQLAEELRREPPKVDVKEVMVAGDPEKKCFEKREKEGIPLRPIDLEFFQQASADTGIKLC